MILYFYIAHQKWQQSKPRLKIDRFLMHSAPELLNHQFRRKKTHNSTVEASNLYLPNVRLILITMKESNKLISLLFFLLLILQSQQIIDSDDVTIISVSISLNQFVKAQGSLEGGTIIFIKGTGFHPQADKNTIHIGPYPCLLIADGANENFLSCRTTKATDPEQEWWLPTTIAVDGKKEVSCISNNCRFNYREDFTPFIEEVVPRSATNGEHISIYGAHYITDLGDGRSHGVGQIENILIGDYSCSLIDVEQEETINKDWRSPIYCNVGQQEAGEYYLEELLDPGRSRLSIRTQQTSYLTGKNYTQRVLPQVDSISAHVGGELGHKLKVEGSGFSSNKQSYNCQIAGQTCTVIDASHDSVTISVPKKDPANTLFGKLDHDTSDLESQQKPYLGGGGARYYRYKRANVWMYITNWMDYLRNNQHSLQLAEQKIIKELSSSEDHGEYYIEYVKGYIYAPVEGEYTFSGLTDDSMLMQLSTVPGNANPANLQDLLLVEQWSYDHYIPFVRQNMTLTKKTVSLKQGYYYFELVSENGGGPGFFKVLMETPNLFDHPVNPVWQLDKFIIRPSSYIAEEIEVRVTGSEGTFELFYYNAYGTKYSAVIPIGADAATFSSKLSRLPNINNYGFEVTLQTLNLAGNQESDESLIETYVYKITIKKYRQETDPPGISIQNVIASPNLPKEGIVQRLVQHSPPLQGTYQILVDGVAITKSDDSPDLDYNEDTWQIQYGFENLYHTPEFYLDYAMDVNQEDSIELYAEFLWLADRGQITFDLSGLSGGPSGSIIEAKIETIRSYSSKSLFSPLPYDFLRTAQSEPSLLLTVNKIPSVCNDCSYQFAADSTPTVASYSREDSLIHIMLSNIASIEFQLSDIEVSLLGVKCLNLEGTTESFTCRLPQTQTSRRMLQSGQPLLPAGNQDILVHIEQVGYLEVDESIMAQTIQMSNVVMFPGEVSPKGLVDGVLSGNGFPVADHDTLSISLCGNVVTKIYSISPHEITFQIPPQINTCQNFPSVIEVNGIQTELTFSYQDYLTPLITQISKTSSSPILKSTITIQGSNFYNEDTLVYLYQDGQRKYELTVTSVTDVRIDCILGGGRSGIYELIVFVPSRGASDPVAFEYRIFIDSLSITQGHLGGGYSITIYGENLAPFMSSNNVFVGDAMNNLCEIVDISSTQITCIMPRMNEAYNADEPQKIVVTARVLEQSICRGTCQFTYKEVGTPLVDLPDQNDFSGFEDVTITGSGLLGATVTVGEIECQVSQISTDSEIIFTYPALPAGEYEILIETSTGWTYPRINSVTQFYFEEPTTYSGSQAGHSMIYRGNGFPDIEKVDAWLVCTKNIKLQLTEVTPTQIHYQIPPFNGNEADRACKINITIGNNYALRTYRYNASRTLSVSVSEQGSFTYNITESTMDYQDFDKVDFVLLDSNENPTSSIYRMQITVVSNQMISVSAPGGYLPAGTFQIRAHKTYRGYSIATPSTVTIAFQSQPQQQSQVTASFLGGKQFILLGTGFVDVQPQNNQIIVCGLRANILSASQNLLTLELPPLVTEVTQNQYGLSQQGVIKGIIFSDTPGTGSQISDQSLHTIYTSINAECFVGYDFGAQAIADIHEIRFSPNPLWALSATYLQGGLFEGSNDNSSWEQIFRVDTSTVHSGFNSWVNEQGQSLKYRFIRFRHNSLSKCQLSEIQIIGFKFSTLPVVIGQDKLCDIKIATQNIILPDAVIYSDSDTSVVTDITPPFGSSLGQFELTINGRNFGSSVQVFIDSIQCQILNLNSTQVVCQVGRRASPPQQGNSFIVISDGNKAIIQSEKFLYMDRWSEQSTWGGEAIPREGDSVYVPTGMTLLVDMSTPLLDTIIVEGKIKFADEEDMTLDAKHFLIINGEFEAGTEDNRYDHNLLITMHGGYYDKQLPIFGNKVLGCLNCIFNMHGQLRNPTWTLVSSTISPGDTSFSVNEPVDWKTGEIIVIAATGFDHRESEQMTIESVSADGLTITVTEPFVFQHYSQIETYGNVEFPMKAQVGLLTRNIKMQGSEESIQEKYGSHLMLTGKEKDGLIGKISYAQFTKCGQPKIVGRYCTHYHMVGEVPKSYIRGVSVHHSVARVLTIHGTHFLLAQKIVGYHVEGHNIFVQDGIETNNVIQDNLMISSYASFLMLQTDITVSSYWITNPYNTFRRNHAAGGDFYGIWYEIKEHPDGPSATSDICPMGMELGESRDNVAHSNGRFGLRIFKLSARKYPCLPTQDQTLLDPYSANPAVHSLFENYTLWRNQECGFLGEQLGYTTIKDFKTADSRKGGLQFHKTNYTKELVIAENALVVGFSQGNRPDDIDFYYKNARGVIASRTDGLKFSGVTFWNFGPTMTPLQSCSECFISKLWVTGGKTTYFQNIQYNNIQGNYIFWENWRRQMFVDLDGSLTEPVRSALGISQQNSATITAYRPSLMIQDHCYQIGESWNSSVYCDQTITMRGLLFTNALPPLDFRSIDIKATLLAEPYQDISERMQIEFSSEPMIVIKKSNDIPGSWAMPFAINNYYNIHWKWGIDFMNMSLAPSSEWDTNDGIVLRFNYTDQREYYQIYKYYQKTQIEPAITALNSVPDPTTCLNGQFYNDIDAKKLFVCVSGRNKTIREWVDLNGVRCDLTCPEEETETGRENFQRLWSNETMWPGGVLPNEGDNVTIPFEWRVKLDIEPPILNYLHINGILRFDPEREETVLQAHYIWVSQGILQAGTEDEPYTSNINIILHGEKEDNYLVLDPAASGNKMLAVTGGLQLFGIEPETVWTRLLTIASIGSTSIEVEEVGGWEIGDKIAIAPSYAGRNQFEEVTIESISGNTVNFSPSLEYEHYGASGTTLSNSYGTLDARSAVGKINRNIKISRGEDANGWGCRVLVYGYLELPVGEGPPVPRNGYAKVKGVQFDHCGQYDSSYAGFKIERLGYHTQLNEIKTELSGNSFHHCGAFCMFMDEISNVIIDNNFFFQARKFLVYAEQVVSDYQFTNNLMIGSLKRQELEIDGTGMVDDTACYQQYVPIDFRANHQILVTNNLCQGSQGEGFVFPSCPCDYLENYPFAGNTAGSCEVAFMYDRLEGEECIGAKGAIGYAAQIGLQANQPGIQTKLIYQNMFFTDNQRGITLRYAHEIDENTCILRNSYFAGYSRPECPDCYSQEKISYCQGGYAVRMFVATITGEIFPLGKHPLEHDVICTRESFDFKAFLDNVTFENYLYNNQQIPYCSGMSVFRRHNLASDGTASHHLTNTHCNNCEQESWAYFEKPNVAWRGWFGGCGEIDCTGPNNYLIYDQDGTFTGKPSQLLSNNSEIGDNEDSCQFIPAMNGHWCDTQDLAVLQYESIAPDFNKRIMWPVFLNYDGGPWRTITNAWREWQWDGVQPMNLRLARFWSVLKLSKTYNLTYSSQPPTDSRFQIQKRLLPDGNEDDWAIIRIYYPIPNSIEVLVTNSTGKNILVKPYPIKNGVSENLMSHTDICGANNFHYQNGTIEFVVNGKANCQVRIRLASYVQLSTRLSIDFNDFYTNDGPTTILTNIAAFLNIDPGRLKIVGISEGSVILNIQITDEPTGGEDIPEQADQELKLRQLTQISQNLAAAVEQVALQMGGQVLQIETSVKVVNQDGEQYTSCSNDIGSTGIYLPNKECQCRLYHHWNKETLRCEPTCNTDLHLGVNEEDDLTCNCRDQTYWDEQLRMCILDCEHIQHSVGQWESETVCECDSISDWNSKTYTCDLDCKQMLHSTGEFDPENNVCVCIQGYVIDGGICERNCLQMEHAIGRDGNICLCDDSSLWSTQLQKCKIVDCSIIPYTSGNGQNFNCECQQNFLWNSEVGQCQILCSELSDSLGAGINLNIHTCQCLPGAIWELSALACVLNCTSYPYSTGANVNAQQCECVENYRWNEGSCILGCGFNAGQIREFDEVQQHCLCESEFEWSFVKNACYLKCYQINNANPDYGPTPSDCHCFTGYTWDSQNRVCNLACNGPYDAGINDQKTQCICEAHTFFTRVESSCQINCEADTLSRRAQKDYNGKCICIPNAFFDDDTNECTCLQGFEQVNLECVASSASSSLGIIMGVIGGGVGTAASIFTGLYIKGRKKRRNQKEGENKVEMDGNPTDIHIVCETGNEIVPNPDL